MLLGMVRTIHADRYARDVASIDPKYFDANERLGRDNIRIGEVLRRGFEVYSVSAEEHPDTINHVASNFMQSSRQRGAGRGFTSDMANLLNGTKLDFILDEWYYIPVRDLLEHANGEAGLVGWHPGRWAKF